ncbi:hypothetical protein E4U51_008227, partial [Claviceps purpurea]
MSQNNPNPLVSAWNSLSAAPTTADTAGPPLSPLSSPPAPSAHAMADAAPPPFVVDDFMKALITAFLPKDLAARNGKLIYSIQQGPAQPLALFLSQYEQGRWE